MSGSEISQDYKVYILCLRIIIKIHVLQKGSILSKSVELCPIPMPFFEKFQFLFWEKNIVGLISGCNVSVKVKYIVNGLKMYKHAKKPKGKSQGP